MLSRRRRSSERLTAKESSYIVRSEVNDDGVTGTDTGTEGCAAGAGGLDAGGVCAIGAGRD